MTSNETFAGTTQRLRKSTYRISLNSGTPAALFELGSNRKALNLVYTQDNVQACGLIESVRDYAYKLDYSFFHATVETLKSNLVSAIRENRLCEFRRELPKTRLLVLQCTNLVGMSDLLFAELSYILNIFIASNSIVFLIGARSPSFETLGNELKIAADERFDIEISVA